MPAYKAPLKDISFVLDHIVEAHHLTAIEVFESATPDIQTAVLTEGARFVEEVIAPLNVVGDKEGAVLEGDKVRTPTGFADAYHQYCEGGWNGIAGPVDFGGQGMPLTFGVAVQEMMSSANMAFSLCPMLSQGAVEAITHHGTADQQKKYLEKLVTGEWTGSMNLTEPQAGSDVGALRTRAEPNIDGSYRIKGQKIFITYGEHDFTENIIHLVLARLPGAPEGTRGISLFIVPKFLVEDDGSLGWRNDLRAVSLEHKLGIHASPTCVMSFGDNDNCVGYLLGEENKGMRCMFTMMNHARLNVGIQGVAAAELAYQWAVSYSHDRIQGVPIGGAAGQPIIGHADVRRMLFTIKAYSEASRAIAYLNAKAIDISHAHPDGVERAKAFGLADLLTPMTKAFSTDIGVECASLALQVHGGMGYIEETGVAQILRDARIAPIYEGTNGIQALDLAGRKLMMDKGVHWQALLNEIQAFAKAMPATGLLGSIGVNLGAACRATEAASLWLTTQNQTNMRAVAAAATPYLRLFAMTVGGYLLAKGAVVSAHKIDKGEGDKEFFSTKISIARFFAEQLLPQAQALAPAITAGDDILFSLTAEQLAG